MAAIARRTMSAGPLALLLEVPLFAGVPAADLERLAGRVRRRRFRRGEVLFHYGDPAGPLYIVAAGRVKVTLPSDEGDEAVLSLMGPGAWLGEVAALDGGPRSATITAVEPTETLAVDRDDLLTVVCENPPFALALIGTLAGRLRRADARLHDAYFHDLDTRLARKLVELAQEHGCATSDGIEVVFPLSQSDLAAMLGAGRPRVNTLLGAYQDAGLVRLGKGSFTVLRLDALRRRAGR